METSLHSSKKRHWTASNYPTSRGLARRLMVYFNIFRFTIAAVILFLVFASTSLQIQPEWIRIARSVAIIYFTNSVLMMALLARNPEQPHILGQFAFIVDIVITMLLIYSLHSLSNGAGLLLVFWCCAAALILPRGYAFFLAGLASIFVIGNSGFEILSQGYTTSALLTAGIYAAACFLGALVFSALARWNQQYELMAEQNVVDLRNLEQINEIIIRRMRTGVIVVDFAGEVRLMNESAWFLLGSPSSTNNQLGAIAPRLMKILRNWRKGVKVADEPEVILPGHSPVIPQFIRIPGAQTEATLIFLQDTAKVSRQASTLATETLAKLSGSIAHEIRNPLSAIVYAGELLNESTPADTETSKLLTIINNQGGRINNIIENILQLSRQERSRPEVIQFNLELQTLVDEYRKMVPDNRLNISLSLMRQPVYGFFDRSQFQQVIHQLLENSATHAQTDNGEIKVRISLDIQRGSGQLILDFIDNGPGIPATEIDKIFEPFYSSHKQGSGLGLYIVQQLCAINQAELSVLSPAGSGALFRLIIPGASRHSNDEN